MSKKQKRVVWPGLALVALAITAFALVEARARRDSNAVISSSPSSTHTQSQGAQAQSVVTKSPAHRNLSLQPEAFNLGHRLGARFSPGKREISTLDGTLTIGSERRTLRTIRTQSDNGEQVAIKLGGTANSLTWDAAQGALSSGSRATSSDRELIERLVLDSPDQFVLAQLRGASYYTVARNVRPAGASDEYSDPLWNIVRVNDPEPDESKRPQSRWRLYYVNVTTGLIDRIESEVQGQRISAEISWTDANGEKVPAQIVWRSQGQTLMTYSLANFSHGEK